MVISNMQTSACLFAEAEAVSLLNRVGTFFVSRGIECYVVGGYIRDGMLGRASHDIDLTVAGDALAVAREIAKAFNAKFVLLDETHQVARVVLTLNEERWHLDLAAMRGSIEHDLFLRDFTINAIAMPLGHHCAGWNNVQLIDPLDGVQDIECARITTVSDSVFIDDPVRLLRAFRLEAELNFVLSSTAETLVRRDVGLVTDVSGERVRDELGRIFENDSAANCLRHMNELGLLDHVMPELAASKGVEQPKEHLWDVFDHSLETVAAVERLLVALTNGGDLLEHLTFTPDLANHFREQVIAGRTRGALLKIAALLHDVAKPHTKRVDENGRIRFLGHAIEGARIADAILKRLRFSMRENRLVTSMIEQHLRPGHLSNADELPTRRAIYRYFRDTADSGIDTLVLSLADHLASRGPMLEMEGWEQHVEVTQYMLAKWFQEETTVSPPKLINGHDLIEEFGMSPGPELGKLLEAVREAQASGEIQSRGDALDFVRKELNTNHAPKR